MAGALHVAPVEAADRDFQAILSRLQCVPSKVTRTELAVGVVSYEVTCKGRTDVVFIACHEADCRQQTKRPDDMERETPQ